MKIKKVRSYRSVTDRIMKAAARSEACTLIPLGRIESGIQDYPVYSLRLSSQNSPKSQKLKVCLSAGIHGDEPAGVEALLKLIETPRRYRSYLREIDFTLFPCINPYGYEHHTRANFQNRDLNRTFDRKRPPKEVGFILKLLGGVKFDLSMEFHEDVDTEGFYLYEVKRKGPYFGERIIRSVSGRCPINHKNQIEGLPSSGGIIRPPARRILDFRRKDWPQAIYLFRNGTRHCVTCETPVNLPLKKRAEVHLIALATALGQLIDS